MIYTMALINMRKEVSEVPCVGYLVPEVNPQVRCSCDLGAARKDFVELYSQFVVCAMWLRPRPSGKDAELNASRIHESVYKAWQSQNHLALLIPSLTSHKF